MRLFFALFPPSHFLQDVAKIQEDLKQVPFSGRWIPYNQLHMTLFFLGEIEDLLLPELIEATRSVFDHPPILFHNSILTYGPPHTFKKRLLWVQFDPQPQFTALANWIYKKLASKWPQLAKPRPLPHVTLARFKPRVIQASFPQSLRSQYLFSQPVLLSSHYSPEKNTHIYQQIYPILDYKELEN